MNTVLKRDFRLQTEEVTVPRNLNTDRYSSPNVISFIKSRIERQAGRRHDEERKISTGFWLENAKKRCLRKI